MSTGFINVKDVKNGGGMRMSEEELRKAFVQGRRGNLLPLIINELIDEFIEEIKNLHEFYLGYIDNYERGGIISELEELIKKWEAKKNNAT